MDCRKVVLTRTPPFRRTPLRQTPLHWTPAPDPPPKKKHRLKKNTQSARRRPYGCERAHDFVIFQRFHLSRLPRVSFCCIHQNAPNQRLPQPDLGCQANRTRSPATRISGLGLDGLGDPSVCVRRKYVQCVCHVDFQKCSSVSHVESLAEAARALNDNAGV